MQKKFILFLLTGLAFLFISCPHDCVPEEYKVFGKYIENFPKWTKDTLASEWKPWNTEETAEFKKLFKQKENLNSGDINYRLFVTRQNLVLFFDDAERTVCNPLWIWVAEYEIDDSISIPQKKDDEFVFEGHAKSNTFEKNTDQNKAYVKIELLNKETGECNYILKVNDTEIINEKMTAYDYDINKNEPHFNDFMEKFNYPKKDTNPRYTMFLAPFQLSIIGDEDYRFYTNEFLYFNKGLNSLEYVYCDLNTNSLTYKLLGGTENMCHYMDIQFVTKDEINCLFYDLIDGKKNVRYEEPLD